MPQAEKAAESHEANKAPIDFSAGRHPHDLDELVHVPTRSRYARKLQEIVDAIEATRLRREAGEPADPEKDAFVGAVYPIGRYNDPGTAANTMKTLVKRNDIPAGVDFTLVPITVDKGTKSVLWAGVVDPNEGLENVDPPEHDDDEPGELPDRNEDV